MPLLTTRPVKALNRPHPLCISTRAVKLLNYLTADPCFGNYHVEREDGGKHLGKGFLTLDPQASEVNSSLVAYLFPFLAPLDCGFDPGSEVIKAPSEEQQGGPRLS